MSEQLQEPMDHKDLKIQALLERVSNLTAQYENQSADLRVAYTLLEQSYNAVAQELQTLKKDTDVQEENPKPSE